MGILFFTPQTLQKQITNLSAASWVLPGCVHETKETSWLKEEDSLENLHSVLFCLIKKHSVKPFVHFWSASKPVQFLFYNVKYNRHDVCGLFRVFLIFFFLQFSSIHNFITNIFLEINFEDTT